MINELVERLSIGTHEIIIGYRGEMGEEIRQKIENGYLHIKFTKTQGGTELGMNVDLNNTNIQEVDSVQGQRILHIEGITNLNYHLVRCIADIDLTTRKGEGVLCIATE